jgi:hypothetical protein
MSNVTQEQWDSMSEWEQAVALNSFLEECHSEFDRKWVELHGDCENPPEDEMEVHEDKSLSHEEKVQRLREMRASKRRRIRRAITKPTDADAVRLHGMGIHLV